MDLAVYSLCKKYTDQVSKKLGKAFKYKGYVNYYNNLPTTGQEVGDCYSIRYKGTSGTEVSGAEYVWGENQDGTKSWNYVGVIIVDDNGVLKIGDANQINELSTNSIVLGDNNTVNDCYDPDNNPTGDIVVGNHNTMEAMMSGIVGKQNTNKGNDSFVCGCFNENESKNSFICGFENKNIVGSTVDDGQTFADLFQPSYMSITSDNLYSIEITSYYSENPVNFGTYNSEDPSLAQTLYSFTLDETKMSTNDWVVDFYNEQCYYRNKTTGAKEILTFDFTKVNKNNLDTTDGWSWVWDANGGKIYSLTLNLNESNNALIGGSYNTSKGISNVVGGRNNNVDGDKNFVVGDTNIANGSYNNVMGQGNIANSNHQTIVGKYNKPNENDLFAVGNGTVSAKNTAFEVLKDGSIILNDNKLEHEEFVPENFNKMFVYKMKDSVSTSVIGIGADGVRPNDIKFHITGVYTLYTGMTKFTFYETTNNQWHTLDVDLIVARTGEETTKTNLYCINSIQSSWISSANITKAFLHKGGQISLEEIDSRFLPIAGSNTLGVIKRGGYSFGIASDGTVLAETMSYDNYTAWSDANFISKGTLNNVLNALVIPQTETVVPFDFGIDLNLNNNKIYIVEETVENFSAAYNITNASQSCEVILTASANGINLSGLEGTPYFYGADCTDGVFTATPSTKYDILFTHDGTRNIAIVMKL